MNWTPYDNLTDVELIRVARDDPNPLVIALMERLEMRRRDLKDLENRYADDEPF